MAGPLTPAEPFHELARAVAFANLDLASVSVPDLTERQIPRGHAYVCAYEPFVREIARAVRFPNDEVPSALLDDFRASIEWWKVLRPVYGFKSRRKLLEAQQRIRRTLEAILGSDGGTLMTELGRASVWTDVVTMSPVIRPKYEKVPKGMRGLLQPVQLGISYMPQPGFPSLAYGILCAGEADLFNRLGRCDTCARFILAKTDRPARYCAHAECRGPGARPRGKAPSPAAEYKRAQRERVQRWREHAAVLRDELESPAPSVAKLSRFVREGRALIGDCFRWGRSAARERAEQLLDQAQARIRTLRAGT
jgi:hypothetical protein